MRLQRCYRFQLRSYYTRLALLFLNTPMKNSRQTRQAIWGGVNENRSDLWNTPIRGLYIQLRMSQDINRS